MIKEKRYCDICGAEIKGPLPLIVGNMWKLLSWVIFDPPHPPNIKQAGVTLHADDGREIDICPACVKSLEKCEQKWKKKRKEGGE